MSTGSIDEKVPYNNDKKDLFHFYFLERFSFFIYKEVLGFISILIIKNTYKGNKTKVLNIKKNKKKK